MKAETLDIYASILAEFSSEVLAAACLVMPKTSKWWPAISELRAACLEVAGERAKIPSVGEAYAEACRLAMRLGQSARITAPDFSNPIVYRAIVQSHGSWRGWCATPLSDEAPSRARFFEVYRELYARAVQQQALPESARHLTAEEARHVLEDVQAKAQQALSSGEERRERRNLSSLVAPKGPAVVGQSMTDDEFAAKKAALLRRLDA